MKSINQFCRFSMILLGGLLLLFCCEPDLDPDNNGNPNNPNPNTNIDPDKASGYLVMNGATKITGQLPAPVDGQLKTNIQDTAYAVLGYPIAAPRMAFKHDDGLDVTAFNVMVNGASFYYQVPAEEQPVEPPPGADSLTVLVLDLQPPGDVALPYTIEVTVQVVDYSGKVIDQFNKWVTVEDPEDNNSCSPLQPYNCGPGSSAFCTPKWEWVFTHQQYDGYIFNPGFWRWAPIWITTGCCVNGSSSFSFESGSLCNPSSNGYKELRVLATGYKRFYEVLYLFDNGEFLLNNSSVVQNISTTKTNFCQSIVGYVQSETSGGLDGTHSYTQGDDHITLNYDNNTSSNSDGRVPFYSGELISTCHVLIIVVPDPEGVGLLEETHVYRLYDPSDGYDFTDPYSND